MKTLRGLLLLVVSISFARAVTYTPINPAPLGEVDLAVLVANEGSDWVRVPDDQDLQFPLAGWDRYFLIGFEDLPEAISDNDFNDVFGKYDSLLGVFQLIASYSGDAHTVTPLAGVLYLDSAGNCCGTADFNSVADTNRIVTFGKPVEAVPEPASATFLLLGMAIVIWHERRIWQAVQRFFRSHRVSNGE